VSEVIAQLFLNLGTKGDVWSASLPGRIYPGKDPVSIVQEAGWAPEPVWIGAENLAPPDPPARSESLYRLSYPGSQSLCVVWENVMEPYRPQVAI
jgi:hypothetical protein